MSVRYGRRESEQAAPSGSHDVATVVDKAGRVAAPRERIKPQVADYWYNQRMSK